MPPEDEIQTPETQAPAGGDAGADNAPEAPESVTEAGGDADENAGDANADGVRD